MSNWAGGVLTAAGRTLQAKVEAMQTSLQITKIKLGDGTESMSAVDNLTDLVSPKIELGVSSATQRGQTATITGIVSSSAIASGFYCREWGLFAQDPQLGEILYMISIDNIPEWLPPSTETAAISATYAMNIAVANSTTVTVAITPAGLVDVDMLDAATHAVTRSTAYTAGDIATAATLAPGLYLKCTQSGTTRAAIIDWSQYSIGQVVTDGTVKWLVCTQALATGDAFIVGDDGNYCPSPATVIYDANFATGADGNLYPVSD